MAIDPRIPLMAVQPPVDFGQSLLQGLQIGQTISGIQRQRRQDILAEEEAKRAAELAPLRQRYLEAQTQDMESKLRERQEEAEIIREASSASKLLPFVQNKDTQGFINALSNSGLTPEEQEGVTTFAKAGRWDELENSANSAIDVGVSRGLFNKNVKQATVKLQEFTDPVTGERAVYRVDQLGNVLGKAPVGAKAQFQQESGAAINSRQLEKQIAASRSSLKRLYDNGFINPQQYEVGNALLDAGDTQQYSGFVRDVTGTRQTTDAQAAARDADTANAMAEWAAEKAQLTEVAKDDAAISEEYRNQLSNVQQVRGLYDQALKLLNQPGGAGTGFLESRLPNFRDSSVMLTNVQQQLGLNVLANSKLAPISNADLNLALSSAIPFEAGEEAVKKFVQDKIAAYDKLIPVLNKGILHFRDRKNGGMATWLKGDYDANQNRPITNPDVPSYGAPSYAPPPPVPPSTGGRFSISPLDERIP